MESPHGELSSREQTPEEESLVDQYPEGGDPEQGDVEAAHTDDDTAPKSRWKRWLSTLKNIGKKIYKVVSSHIGLILILLLYAFLGAGIFQAIEGGVEEEKFNQEIKQAQENENTIKLMKQNISNILLQLTNEVSDIESQALRLEIEKHVNQLHSDILMVYSIADKTNQTFVQPWTFWSSLLFCATVFTTIGKC